MNPLPTIKRIPGATDLPTLADLPQWSEGDHAPRLDLPDAIPIRPRIPGPAQGNPLERHAVSQALQPTMTLPERIIYKYLVIQRLLFEVQYNVAGGRLLPGGSVVDFIVHGLAARPLALRIQGDYWHGPKFPTRQVRDDQAAARLRRQGYIPVDLWESDIYQAALAGRLQQFIDDAIAKST